MVQFRQLLYVFIVAGATLILVMVILMSVAVVASLIVMVESVVIIVNLIHSKAIRPGEGHRA